MAAEAPDPKTFESWEEAFQYPIPVIRGMERALRRDIDSNHEKLRTLVGASYRDLLGTAESIIEMDKEMHNVEAYIGEIGQRCNTKLLGKKGANLRTWAKQIEAPNSARYAFASQLSVLRSCPDLISRILKSGASVLLAAKVLVISRLLYTKLSQQPHPSLFLETLRSRLGSLRRRLLSRINGRFKSLELARDLQVEAMCAFALATSSSSKDVLRHYHHIRLEAISENMVKVATGHANILLALRIYVKTLKDTQAVVPGQLAHALETLKSVPLFRSEDVYTLMELNLDVHERWVGDDIKTFTPYIRHDDLSKAEAEASLKQWAKKAFSSLLDGLRDNIQDIEDPLVLVQLRRKVFELWFSSHQNSIGVNAAETLDGLRDVFNSQSSRIIDSRASSLVGIGMLVQEILHNWQPGVSDLTPSLWEPSMTSMDMANGGMAFRRSLITRSIGKNGPLSRASELYTAFLEGIEAVEEMIKNIRQTKWAADVDDVDDDDDLLDNKQVLLSEDDPGLLQETLKSALNKSYEDLQEELNRSLPPGEDASCGQRSSFLVRIWREVRERLPKSYQGSDFGQSSIPILQKTIAGEALRMPLERYSKRIVGMSAANGFRERLLWEGDPDLPVLPSAWTYRFLSDLVSSMSSYGADIWTTQATDELKKALVLGIPPLLERHRGVIVPAMNGHANTEAGTSETKVPEDGDMTNGQEDRIEERDAKTPDREVKGALANGDSIPHEENSRDARLQRLFDVIYLINATAVKCSQREDNALEILQSALIRDLALEEQFLERLKKGAGEYWKRTALLFALLA